MTRKMFANEAQRQINRSGDSHMNRKVSNGASARPETEVRFIYGLIWLV